MNNILCKNVCMFFFPKLKDKHPENVFYHLFEIYQFSTVVKIHPKVCAPQQKAEESGCLWRTSATLASPASAGLYLVLTASSTTQVKMLQKKKKPDCLWRRLPDLLLLLNLCMRAGATWEEEQIFSGDAQITFTLCEFVYFQNISFLISKSIVHFKSFVLYRERESGIHW